MAKKWLTLLLAMWMLLSCAALAEEPAVDFATLEGVIAYEEPVEISFARSVDPTATIDESDPRMKSYSENIWTTTFKEALNIDVTYDWIATDADSNNAKWGAAIASGDLPDAASVTDQVYKQLLEAGLVADMTDIYEAEASSLYKSLNTQDILDNMTTGGRMYGLPLPGNKYIGNAVLFVRTDWMEQLGLELPETIDDVVNMARAFKEAKLGGEDTIGLMFADGSGVNDGHLKGFMNGYGAYRNIWVEVDGKLAWSNTLPEMREALLALQALYAEGLINQDFAVTNGTVAQEFVASGKCGIFYSTDYAVTMSMQAAVDLDPNADFACVGIPGLTADAQTQMQTGAITVNKVFVNVNCEHPEAAIKWLDYWLGQEGTMKTTWYGIEGRDWEYTDEYESLVGETPSILIKASLEGAGNTDVPAHTGVPTYVTREMFEQTAVDPESTGRTYPDYRAHMNYEPYCVKGNIPEIVWCSDEELVIEYSELSTLIGEYVRSSYASFILGRTDIDNDDDWQAYLDGLEELGLSRYLEVLDISYGLN